jgi:hypothetical protein
VADTIADRIISAIQTRLQTITVANGFSTNAGNAVYLDRASLDSEQTFPAILVFDLEEESEPLTNRRQRNRMTIQVVGFAQDTDCRPLVGDIKDAVLDATDTHLSGLAHNVGYDGYQIERPEDGSRFARVNVLFNAEYDENYGDPYTLI